VEGRLRTGGNPAANAQWAHGHLTERAYPLSENAPSMTRAYIIAEGMRPGSSLEDLEATLVRIDRAGAGNAAPDQPRIWTTVTFESSLDPDRLAAKLSKVLDDRPARWYSHFRAGDEMFVVFPARILRYPVGDQAGKVRVQEYARSIGVPGRQIDWDET